MAKGNTHIHRYAYVNIGAKKQIMTYACSECSHYMPTHTLNTRTHLQSRCWECSEPFIIDLSENNAMHPVCEECQENRNRIRNGEAPIPVNRIPLDSDIQDSTQFNGETKKRKLTHDEAVNMIAKMLQSGKKIE